MSHDEVSAIYASMSAAEKAAAFKEGLVNFENLNKHRQLQFEQFELTNTMMSAMESFVINTGDAKKEYGWLTKAAQSLNGVLFSKTIKNLKRAMQKYNKNKQVIKQRILKGENFSEIFNDLLPKGSNEKKSIDEVFSESWYSLDIKAGRLDSFDVSKIENKFDLLKFKALIVKKLRDTETTGGHYETARSLALEELEFDFKKIEKEKFSTVKLKNLNGEEIKVQKDIYEEAKKKVFEHSNRSQLIGDITTQLKEENLDTGDATERADAYLDALIMETYSRNRSEKIGEYMYDNDLHKNMSPEKQVFWDQYKDSAGIGNFDLADESWDTILEELAINAPLIIVSGGAASLARAGISASARAVAGRAGLNAIRIAKMGKWANRGRKLGKIAGLGIEAAAFEGVHGGLMEGLGSVVGKDVETIWNANGLGEVMNRVAWTAATLGVFKQVHKFGFGAKFVNKFASNVTGKYANILKTATASGITLTNEALAMVFIAAAQNGAYKGDVNEIWKTFTSSDEWFHAFVSAGALRVSGSIVNGSRKRSGETKNSSIEKSTKTETAEVKSESGKAIKMEVVREKSETKKSTKEVKTENIYENKRNFEAGQIIKYKGRNGMERMVVITKMADAKGSFTVRELGGKNSWKVKLDNQKLIARAKQKIEVVKTKAKSKSIEDRSVLDMNGNPPAKVVGVKQEKQLKESKKKTNEPGTGSNKEVEGKKEQNDTNKNDAENINSAPSELVTTDNIELRINVVNNSELVRNGRRRQKKLMWVIPVSSKLLPKYGMLKSKTVRLLEKIHDFDGMSIGKAKTRLGRLVRKKSIEKRYEELSKLIKKWEGFKIQDQHIKRSLKKSKNKRLEALENQTKVNNGIENIQKALREKQAELIKEMELQYKSENVEGRTNIENIARRQKIDMSDFKVETPWESKVRDAVKLNVKTDYLSKGGIERASLNIGDIFKISETHSIKILESNGVSTKFELTQKVKNQEALIDLGVHEIKSDKIGKEFKIKYQKENIDYSIQINQLKLVS